MPTLAIPEPAPAKAVCAWFHHPDMFAPKLPKPEPPPAPVLKKPDDGTVVVFPMPGVGGMLISGMSPAMT
ncbi:Uncharacterised protein [Mycobacterium tuberculosis]|uniref:Uncharacterized protein n=1 Tax=Mycobacterium tuberculosis TaxID=1773 RepID=A0A655ATD4_MYCTX|nr:Uncharacterised protein [Mycobacterium tuberculosis]CFH22627.1 Uncharacterised protein [Mycobacterium tuberculosis]CFR74008.1 Uncharacterised protein [Mycobacterium tuberculosis]CKN19805.1 Uncharacterised protein [Mycobacterium tuberculosis]CKN29848.1 Uncharacterised protein [Mycobacterium tuberculosis]